MSWILKALAGPLKGKTYPVASGLTLGRQGATVEIPDTKASSIHARIIQEPSGRWYLEDNKSKNGTRIDGEKVPRVELSDGLEFSIGDQKFEIVEVHQEGAGPSKTSIHDEKTVVVALPREDRVVPPPMQPPPKAAPPPPPPRSKPRSVPIAEEVTRVEPAPKSAATPEPAPKTAAPPAQENVPAQTPAPAPAPAQRYWNDVLAEFLETHLSRFGDRPRPVSPLNPAVILEFVRGVQHNSRWVLGYGPRKIGARSLDLPLFEPTAPDVAFEIVPSPDGILFKTNHPKMVTLNGEGVDSRLLRVGDTIRINDTMIEVDFSE